MRGNERQRRIEALFEQALDHPTAERSAFLIRACGSDRALRSQVEALLAADDGADAYFADLAHRLGMPHVEEAAATTPLERARAGDRIGPYRLMHELGRGGMGMVYLAERADEQFEQQVALKLIKRGMDTAAIRRRFLRERRILARLQHPNIARLYDGGVTDDGLPYFVMEYIEGTPIDVYCDRHRLGIDARLRLFQDVARAVQYAHGNLIIHRDLKPSNIFVTESGTTKLLDFGIAKLLDEETDITGQFTQMGVHIMTPAYAAPEQAGDKAVTTATDVYALGLVLYELLTGHRPVHMAGRSTEEVIQAILHEQPERPSTAIRRTEERTGADGTTETVTPDMLSRARGTQVERLRRRLSGDLDTICLMALRKEPERRYASAEIFVEDIRRHLAGLPVRARPDTLGYRFRKFVGRHQVGMVVSAVLVALLISYAATVVVQARRIAAEAARTEQVKDFLTSLFTWANPGVNRGGELTALELVEEGTRRVETELGDEPELQAELRTVLGELFGALGRYEAAVAQLGPALEIRRDLLGPWHEEVARTAHALGYSLHHQGHFDEAERPFREALAIRSRLFGEQSHKTALTLDELGDLLHSRGELVEAEEVLRRALTIGVAVMGETGRAVVQRHLANVRRDRGAVEEAEAFYRRSLAVLEKRYGPVHPVTALTQSELALLLAETKRYEEAEALLEENFRVYARLYPQGHAMEGTTLRNLGVLRLRQGRPAEAREALERCLTNYHITLSKPHALVPRAQRYLAEATLALGDAEGAAALAGEALNDLRRLGLTGHPAAADALETVALARMAQGRPAEAADLLSESIDVRTRSNVASDPRLEVTRRRLDEARTAAQVTAHQATAPANSQRH